MSLLYGSLSVPGAHWSPSNTASGTPGAWTDTLNGYSLTETNVNSSKSWLALPGSGYYARRVTYTSDEGWSAGWYADTVLWGWSKIPEPRTASTHFYLVKTTLVSLDGPVPLLFNYNVEPGSGYGYIIGGGATGLRVGSYFIGSATVRTALGRPWDAWQVVCLRNSANDVFLNGNLASDMTQESSSGLNGGITLITPPDVNLLLVGFAAGSGRSGKTVDLGCMAIYPGWLTDDDVNTISTNIFTTYVNGGVLVNSTFEAHTTSDVGHGTLACVACPIRLRGPAYLSELRVYSTHLASATMVSVVSGMTPVAPSSLAWDTDPGENWMGAVGSAYDRQMIWVSQGEAVVGTSSTLPPGLTLTTAGRLSGVFTSGGTYSVVFQVSNIDQLLSATLTRTFYVQEPLYLIYSGLTLPLGAYINIPPPRTATVDVQFVPAFQATGLPHGLLVNASTGRVTGQTFVAGSWTVVFTVSYQTTLTAQQSVTLVVRQLNVNEIPGPLWGNTVAYVDETVSVWPDSTAFGTFEITPSLPAGLTLDASTGVIQGIPQTVSEEREYTITSVHLTQGHTATSWWTLGVYRKLLVLRYSEHVEVDEGELVNVKPIALPTNNAFDFTTSDPLPVGLLVNADTGVLSGTARHATLKPLTITITAHYTVSEIEFTITSNALSVQVYRPFSYPLVLRLPVRLSPHGMEDLREFSAVLPPGLVLDENTGVLSGSYTLASAQRITVRAVGPEGQPFRALLTLPVSQRRDPLRWVTWLLLGVGSVLLVGAASSLAWWRRNPLPPSEPTDGDRQIP